MAAEHKFRAYGEANTQSKVSVLLMDSRSFNMKRSIGCLAGLIVALTAVCAAAAIMTVPDTADTYVTEQTAYGGDVKHAWLGCLDGGNRHTGLAMHAPAGV